MSQPVEAKENEQYAYFSLRGDFSAVDVTSRAGVTPRKFWQKGDLHHGGRVREESWWSLESRLPRGATLEDHIKDVLEQLDKNEALFIELTRLHTGCMQLVGYFRDRYPGLNFEGELVAGLAKYRLSVDFDFYFPDGT